MPLLTVNHCSKSRRISQRSAEVARNDRSLHRRQMSKKKHVRFIKQCPKKEICLPERRRRKKTKHELGAQGYVCTSARTTGIQDVDINRYCFKELKVQRSWLQRTKSISKKACRYRITSISMSIRVKFWHCGAGGSPQRKPLCV